METATITADSPSPVRALLRDSPSLPILLISVAAFVYMAGKEGGFLGTTFLGIGLLMLALLGVALVALPRPSPNRATMVAVASFGAFAAFSYLSMLWAGQKGVAWDGANRTAMYAIVFALFALWPVRGSAAAVLLGAYGLGIAGIGLVELLRAAASTDPVAFFHEGRLSEPTGYANANVALWFTAFWPCALLSARKTIHPALRGLLLGGAGLLMALAILGQSRSWLASLPIMAVIVLLVVPGRARTLVSLGLLGIAAAATLGSLNAAYSGFRPPRPPTEYFAQGAHKALYAAAALAVAGVVWGLIDRYGRAGPRTARAASATVFVIAALAVGAGAVGFVVKEGNPFHVASNVWKEFKKGEGEPGFQGSRFGLAAGSYRYDYFRVALNNFAEHPIAGVGVENFGSQYLVHGRTDETPLYPHSIGLRVLSMTGIIGTALFLAWIVAALIAAAQVIRREGRATRPAGTTAAAAGVVMFAYFIFHGSLDWIWEFAGLGSIAIAGLALAGVVDRPVRTQNGAMRVPTLPLVLVGAPLAAAMAIAFTLPWLSELDLQEARSEAASNPTGALARLDRSARFNPLQANADITAGLIESRRGLFGAAEAHFREASRRDPRNSLPLTQLAAIVSQQGRPDLALGYMARARRLEPRDRVSERVQRLLLTGKVVSPARVNQLILSDLDRRIGPK